MQNARQFNPDTKEFIGKTTVDDTSAYLHLIGKTGLAADLQINGKCQYVVADIDDHKLKEQVVRRIQHIDLPFTLSSSRSGKVHIWLGFKESVLVQAACDVMKTLLAPIVSKSDHQRNVEIYPMGTSSVVFLPYFNVLGTEDSVAGLIYQDGNWVRPNPLDQPFKQVAMSTVKRVLDRFPFNIAPCMATIYWEGSGEGTRNNIAYSIGALDIPRSIFDTITGSFSPPLPEEEALRAYQSGAQGGKGPKCNSSPMCDHCTRDVCLKRKYGVKPSIGQSIGELPFRIVEYTVHEESSGNEYVEALIQYAEEQATISAASIAAFSSTQYWISQSVKRGWGLTKLNRPLILGAISEAKRRLETTDAVDMNTLISSELSVIMAKHVNSIGVNSRPDIAANLTMYGMAVKDNLLYVDQRVIRKVVLDSNPNATQREILKVCKEYFQADNRKQIFNEKRAWIVDLDIRPEILSIRAKMIQETHRLAGLRLLTDEEDQTS